jgi:hypothetical protein
MIPTGYARIAPFRNLKPKLDFGPERGIVHCRARIAHWLRNQSNQ